MKLALCQKCQTIVPANKPAGEFRLCPCTESAIMYTGEDNEVSVSGPLTIIGIDDEAWQALLAGPTGRIMPTVVTVPRTSSTVIDLDADENEPSRQASEQATHIMKATGEYYEAIELTPESATLRNVVTGEQWTITRDLLRLSYTEIGR